MPRKPNCPGINDQHWNTYDCWILTEINKLLTWTFLCPDFECEICYGPKRSHTKEFARVEFIRVLEK